MGFVYLADDKRKAGYQGEENPKESFFPCHFVCIHNSGLPVFVRNLETC